MTENHPRLVTRLRLTSAFPVEPQNVTRIKPNQMAKAGDTTKSTWNAFASAVLEQDKKYLSGEIGLNFPFEMANENLCSIQQYYLNERMDLSISLAICHCCIGMNDSRASEERSIIISLVRWHCHFHERAWFVSEGQQQKNLLIFLPSMDNQ